MDTDRPGVYFMNTETHPAHNSFLSTVDLERDQDGLIIGEISYDSELVAPDGSPGVYRYRLDGMWLTYRLSSPITPYSIVARSYALLAASMPLLDDNLAFHIPNNALPNFQSELPLYRESRINLLFDEDILPETRFLALNTGEGYGLLRVMEPDERPNPREVVVYEALPNELPRVAGIVSTVPQTPLSHVNLRAVQDDIPNAFIRGALDEPTIEPLLGSYVHYTVTESGWTLRAATRAEVDAHYAASRPAAKQTPQRDLTVMEITALSDVGFADWTAFGVKAANVAVLGTLGFPAGTVPDGFAAPFYFYDEFMKHNELYDDIETMLADPDFQTDFDTQESELKKLRKKIKKGTTPDWIITALEDMHAEFPEGTSLRYRSSTNNEDLPGFNGAGLYDSKTQDPDETEEDGIDKSIKGVWKSLWNFRAFVERDFHRIDHLAAAMGVLVHPNYSGELANGVAVSFDPIYGSDGSYYINTQVGEDLVTNPDALSVPEEILLNKSGTYTVLATSNQALPGQLLMTDGQLDQLRSRLAAIHEKFAKLYGIGDGEQFAMEIEFKITSDNILAIKQARPWVFDDASTTPPPTPNVELPDGPVVGVILSPSDPVLEDTEIILATLTFGGLEQDSDASTTDYMFRADVVSRAGRNADADACEGPGVDNDRYIYKVDEDPETRTSGISPNCPPGGYTLVVSISSADSVELATASADFSVNGPTPVLSTDATLSSLTLSGVTLGAFDPATTGYTATVPNDVTQTTVTPTLSDDGATYAIKLGGATDADGVIPLAVGSNVITIEVTAEDGNTAKTYTVTVTRAAPTVSDATLNSLTLSDAPFTFASDTTSYDVNVANGVDETTVTATANDDGATYVVKLDGVADDDEVIPLSVGSNTITIEVTAEDGNTAKTYTVTVTRAEPFSTDATLSNLALSGLYFGTFDSATTGYTASVANDVDETTVTPATNDAGATYKVKLDGVADADGTVSLAVGSNVITIEVTAEDGNTAKTYTVTVTRATPTVSGPAVAIGLSPSGSVAEGTEITVTMSFANLESDTDTSDTDYIFRADVVNADACEGGGMGNDRYMYKVDEDPEVRTGSISTSCAPGDYTVEVSISSPGNAELASATADFTVSTPAQQQPPPEPPASTDATLSGLTLSNVDFGAFDIKPPPGTPPASPTTWTKRR